MQAFSLSVSNKIERHIRDAECCQYIISNKSSEIMETLRMISIRSGMAVYSWKSGAGLINIKSGGETPLPATRSLIDALKYAQKNHYFAVYVFPAYSEENIRELQMSLPSAFMLMKTGSNTRLLFLIEEDKNYSLLFKNCEQIELANKDSQRYKLRDSKWVLSND